MAKLINVKSVYDWDYKAIINCNWENVNACCTREELISLLNTGTMITILAMAAKRRLMKSYTAKKDKKAVIVSRFADEILADRERRKREENEAMKFRLHEQNRKIKRCPCCDGEAEVKHSKRGAKIQCNSCGVNSGLYPSAEIAAEVWNNRAGDSDYDD